MNARREAKSKGRDPRVDMPHQVVVLSHLAFSCFHLACSHRGFDSHISVCCDQQQSYETLQSEGMRTYSIGTTRRWRCAPKGTTTDLLSPFPRYDVAFCSHRTKRLRHPAAWRTGAAEASHSDRAPSAREKQLPGATRMGGRGCGTRTATQLTLAIKRPALPYELMILVNQSSYECCAHAPLPCSSISVHIRSSNSPASSSHSARSVPIKWFVECSILPFCLLYAPPKTAFLTAW